MSGTMFDSVEPGGPGSLAQSPVFYSGRSCMTYGSLDG